MSFNCIGCVTQSVPSYMVATAFFYKRTINVEKVKDIRNKNLKTTDLIFLHSCRACRHFSPTLTHSVQYGRFAAGTVGDLKLYHML